MKFFVPFEAVKEYEKPTDHLSMMFGPFEYDHITDEDIQLEIDNGNAKSVKLATPWDQEPITKTIHARRIAALVLLIEKGMELDPVEMELSEYNKNTNFVTDGHHRIRAYKFAKKNGFWASLGGFETLIKEFKTVCRKHY